MGRSEDLEGGGEGVSGGDDGGGQLQAPAQEKDEAVGLAKSDDLSRSSSQQSSDQVSGSAGKPSKSGQHCMPCSIFFFAKLKRESD